MGGLVFKNELRLSIKKEVLQNWYWSFLCYRMLYYFSAFGYIHLDWGNAVVKVALVALVATLVESLPICEVIDDNISVPVSTMLTAMLAFGYVSPHWSNLLTMLVVSWMKWKFSVLNIRVENVQISSHICLKHFLWKQFDQPVPQYFKNYYINVSDFSTNWTVMHSKKYFELGSTSEQ